MNWIKWLLTDLVIILPISAYIAKMAKMVKVKPEGAWWLGLVSLVWVLLGIFLIVCIIGIIWTTN